MPPVIRSTARISLRLLLACLAMAGSAMVAQGDEAPGDIRFERNSEVEGSAAFPPSIFPHWVHRINYRCDACHDRLWEMQAGSAEITMDMISAGESCGSCHNGEQAFDSSVASCGRCHVQEGD